VVKYLKTAEIRQTLRISSKVLHEVIPKAKVQLSKEYLYFKNFFIREVVTNRQINYAFERFRKLPPQIQDTMKDELQVNITTIRGCASMRDILTWNEPFRSMIHHY